MQLLRLYSWFSGQFLNMEKHFIIIFAWSALLIHHGTKGDIAILSTHLNLKEASTLAVQPGTTNPSRVIWRKSTKDVNNLPTTPDSLIMQWVNNIGFFCQDGTNGDANITCGKYKMTEDFGLVFTTVDLNDGKQKFWFEVSANLITTSASVVPKVCDYGSVELSSCANDRCTCSVVRFTPETDFTLEWTRDGNQVEGVTPPDIEEDVDGNYFSATSTISTEKMPGDYICCASGDAYYFASSKKLCTSPTTIEVPTTTVDPTTADSTTTELTTLTKTTVKQETTASTISTSATSSATTGNRVTLNPVISTATTLSSTSSAPPRTTNVRAPTDATSARPTEDLDAVLVVEGTYTDALADQQSSAFQDLQTTMMTGMATIDGIAGTTDYSFSSGSIKASFTIQLEPNADLTTEKLEMEIETAFSNGAFTGLTFIGAEVTDAKVTDTNTKSGTQKDKNIPVYIGLGVGVPFLIIVACIVALIVWKIMTKNKVKPDEKKDERKEN